MFTLATSLLIVSASAIGVNELSITPTFVPGKKTKQNLIINLLKSQKKSTLSHLLIHDVYVFVEECTVKTKPGDFLAIHYSGKIDESSPAGEANSQFDSSYPRGEPIEFQLGVGQVIPGVASITLIILITLT